jgi:hypothetical protein
MLLVGYFACPTISKLYIVCSFDVISFHLYESQHESKTIGFVCNCLGNEN